MLNSKTKVHILGLEISRKKKRGLYMSAPTAILHMTQKAFQTVHPSTLPG